MLENKDELKTLSIDQLWSLHEEISAVLSARLLDEKRELEKRLAILNHDSNPELLRDSRPARGQKARRKYPRVLPRYRNPKTSETWSGRGKRPRWVTVAVGSGHHLEEFLIRD